MKIDDVLIRTLFNDKNFNFHEILNKLKIDDDENLSKKSNLVFDNLNLIVRHYNDDIFKLIQFIIAVNKRSGK